VEESLLLSRNPDIVVVDPEVIVQAPLRFFVAGIGDALSTGGLTLSSLTNP